MVLVQNGACKGKLAAIVEIIDQRKVLVDGPASGVPRQAVHLSQVVLTPLKFNLTRGARSATVARKWASEDVSAKWEATSWAKKISQRKTRSELSDFQRFQVMVLRKQKRYALKKAVAKA